MRPLVSVIIPIRDNERQLSECLSDLQYQTLINWEAIIVDYGSDGKSLECCLEFAALDDRITVCTRRLSAADAVNIGIERARADFIVFIKPSDRLHNEFLIRLLNGIESENTVMSVCKAADGGFASARLHGARYISREKAFTLLSGERGHLGYGIFGKLFSKKLIDREGLSFETEPRLDIELLFMLGYLSAGSCGSRVTVIEKELYSRSNCDFIESVDCDFESTAKRLSERLASSALSDKARQAVMSELVDRSISRLRLLGKSDEPASRRYRELCSLPDFKIFGYLSSFRYSAENRLALLSNLSGR